LGKKKDGKEKNKKWKVKWKKQGGLKQNRNQD
jgi:hypothetical protein